MRVLVKEIIEKEGEQVELCGWVAARRDHGKIIFIDLRDRSGIAQVVFTPKNQELYKLADGLRSEWVIKIIGKVSERPKGMENSQLITGKVEVAAENLEILNPAKTPPFNLDGDGYDINEEIRLKYRYLDLRRERLQKNLKLRHQAIGFIRDFLAKRDFIETETPMLTKSTPEGSRDFVVPSRLQPGKFYALPQSPQQYKQLLMVAGLERYFQFARALRDEDLRADRGFEHTQIDLEMSFAGQKDVMNLIEEMIIELFDSFGKKIIQKPFPIYSYKEAMEKFGADKFDLRENKNSDEFAFAWVVDFPMFVKDDKGKWTYGHNPFTAPRLEDEEKLISGNNLGDITALQYDLVCNSYEVGGGGVRINKAPLLRRVFEIIGHSDEIINKEFGHMLEAFEYGAPPHAGIAIGLDRLMMLICGESALREVVAFPASSGGQTAVMDAPSELTNKQLKELNLKIEFPKK
ncbi:MAG: aspartate--tRNA ligase [Candidatus Brennerbacteria bacterium]|nr:aspartate--tRNA ligase [Candidatus Brennerbacteria bacterium]